jgi:hypothetical protein
MDTILVVCYSYTGVSRKVAQRLSSQEGWQLGTILDESPRSAMRCALDSLLRRRPAVRYEGPSPGDFRTVVLVSPIWVYRLAGPMRSFIAAHRDALQRVAVISTMGSSGASNAVAEVARLLGHAPVLSAAFTQRAIEDGSCIPALLAFGDRLQPPTASPAAQPPQLPQPLYVPRNEP